MTKAIVLVVPDEFAEEVSRLVAGSLCLNGIPHNDPAVLDWPVRAAAPDFLEAD